MNRVTRRTLLLSSALASAALAWDASAAIPNSILFLKFDPASHPFPRVARLLFPHDALADEVYEEISVAILEGTNGLGQLKLLVDGAQTLDSARGTPFVSLQEDEQIAVLKEIEGTPFFATMLGEARNRLYNDPRVWAVIGYGGPSLEFGGYIERGFDDIDWLEDA